MRISKKWKINLLWENAKRRDDLIATGEYAFVCKPNTERIVYGDNFTVVYCDTNIGLVETKCFDTEESAMAFFKEVC